MSIIKSIWRKNAKTMAMVRVLHMALVKIESWRAERQEGLRDSKQ